MLAFTARRLLNQKAKQQRKERQPIRSFANIFKSDDAEQAPAVDARYLSPAWRRFFASMRPARQWLLPEGDKAARDALTPPSGARATLAVLGY